MPIVKLSDSDELDAPVSTVPEGFVPLASHIELDPAPVQQMTGLAREAALPASNVAKGVLQTLGLPGDALKAGIGAYSHYIGAPFQRLVTGQPANELSGANPFDSANLLAAGRGVGMTDRPDLVPQTARERYEAAGAQGVGAALPLTAMGDISAIPRTVLSGVGSGMGSELGKELLPSHPVVGALAGGLVGGVGGGSLATAGGKVVNAVAGVSDPVVAAYRHLGMTPALAGDVTGNPLLQQLQAYSAKSPGGAGIVGPAQNRSVSQFDNALETTAQNLGNSRSAQAAGTVLQDEARNWRDVVFPARQQAAWAPVDQAMAGASVDPSNYRGALTALSSKLAALPETQKALLPGRTQKLLEAINTDVPPGATIPWDQAQNLRSAVGEMMGVPKVVEALGQKQLSQAYGGISEDMKAAATANGAQGLFANANAVSTAGHSFIQNVLGRFIKSNNPAQETVTPEKAAEAALSGGDTVLHSIRSEMPQAADELAAYKLRDMGLATPGAAGRTGMETSPGTFLTDLNRLRQNAPSGSAALFGYPGVQRNVDALATVANSIKETARRVNQSNTGPFSAMAEMLTGGIGGYQIGGVKGALMGSVAPFGANSLLAAGISRPSISPFLATPIPEVPGLGNRLTTSAVSAYPAANSNPLSSGQ